RSIPDAYPLPRIHHILERLRNARFISTLDLRSEYWQIPLNRDKCSFFQRSLKYLGHVISESGIHTDPDKIAAIRELQLPTNVRQLRRCLGEPEKFPDYYWSGLFREVTKYVRRCPTCQKYKVSQLKPAGRMFTRQVEEPFSVVCADFMDPFPRSRHGNTMLLVFLDSHTS
ncbi:hypothetical protein KR059_000404, partial [Drosophila kikkawai]